MREIKFRAWDIDKNKYITCFDISDEGCVWTQEPCCSPDYPNVILEQYTGLKDKNCQKIYEGDIVSEEFEYCGDKTKTIWQVRWCDDECAFELHYVSGFEVDDCSLVSDDEEDYEIIGNIHENPELLEKEK